MSRQSCATCAFLLLKDEGYSNWTVEAHCIVDAHPKMPGVTSYRLGDPEYWRAEYCNVYRPGEPVEIDVEWDRTPSTCRRESTEAILAYVTDPVVRLTIELKGYTL